MISGCRLCRLCPNPAPATGDIGDTQATQASAGTRDSAAHKIVPDPIGIFSSDQSNFLSRGSTAGMTSGRISGCRLCRLCQQLEWFWRHLSPAEFSKLAGPIPNLFMGQIKPMDILLWDTGYSSENSRGLLWASSFCLVACVSPVAQATSVACRYLGEIAIRRESIWGCR